MTDREIDRYFERQRDKEKCGPYRKQNLQEYDYSDFEPEEDKCDTCGCSLIGEPEVDYIGFWQEIEHPITGITKKIYITRCHECDKEMRQYIED